MRQLIKHLEETKMHLKTHITTSLIFISAGLLGYGLVSLPEYNLEEVLLGGIMVMASGGIGSIIYIAIARQLEEWFNREELR